MLLNCIIIIKFVIFIALYLFVSWTAPDKFVSLNRK
jgi:hypothetical protein